MTQMTQAEWTEEMLQLTELFKPWVPSVEEIGQGIPTGLAILDRALLHSLIRDTKAGNIPPSDVLILGQTVNQALHHGGQCFCAVPEGQFSRRVTFPN